MFVLTYAAAILAILYAMSAAAFLVYRRRTPLDLALVLYLATAAVWIGANVAADVSYTSDVLVLASGIAFIAGGANLLACLILIDTVIDGRVPPWQRILIYAVLTSGVTPFAFTELGIAGTYFPPGEPAQIVPGVLYTLGVFSLPAYLLYGTARLIYGVRRNKDKRRRMQILYVLSGLLLTLAGQALFDIILPLAGELRLFELGPISSLFFALGTSYAVVRHKLVDIRVVVQRGLIYSILFLLLSAFYAAVLWLMGATLGARANVGNAVSAIVTLMVGAVTAPFLDRLFRRATDRLFFKDRYRYADALHELSRILYTHLSLAELVSESEKALARLLRAESLHITLAADERPCPAAALRVPLITDSESIGFIEAGPKRSGDPYTSEDEQLLTTFAYQAATAFSRAQLFEKTREHARELEAKVAERTQALTRAHEAERTMVADLSHALQTPLAILQSAMERAKQKRTFGDQYDSLEQSVQALSNYIYDLLGIATLDRTLQLEAKRPFSLSDLVASIADEMTIITAGEGVTVERAITLGITYTGNQKRIREALVNLAHNARKYLASDGPHRIGFSLTREAHRIAIAISDTGVGIPKEAQHRIFERFYRGANHTEAGTGLGLAIVKRIIEDHGGTISVKSTPNHGSTFTIVLPEP